MDSKKIEEEVRIYEATLSAMTTPQALAEFMSRGKEGAERVVEVIRNSRACIPITPLIGTKGVNVMTLEEKSVAVVLGACDMTPESIERCFGQAVHAFIQQNYRPLIISAMFPGIFSENNGPLKQCIQVIMTTLDGKGSAAFREISYEGGLHFVADQWTELAIDPTMAGPVRVMWELYMKIIGSNPQTAAAEAEVAPLVNTILDTIDYERQQHGGRAYRAPPSAN